MSEQYRKQLNWCGDEIDRLRAANERLGAALKVFCAHLGEPNDWPENDGMQQALVEARAALADPGKGSTFEQDNPTDLYRADQGKE